MVERTVHKFGGAALRDGAAIRRAAQVVAGDRAPCVVVSALAGVTDMLLAAARAAAADAIEADAVRIRHRSVLAQLGLDPELLDPWFAELVTALGALRARRSFGAELVDHVLSFGERMSARILAAHLRACGTEAAPVDAFDLELSATEAGARPLCDGAARALASFPGVPVVTGFLARGERGRIATLGRDGSDLTATLLGEALAAREVVLWKQAPGLCTADPRLVPEARAIPAASLALAVELAGLGAPLLFPRALVPARRASLALRLADPRAPAACGTRLEPGPGGALPRVLVTRGPLVELEGPAPPGAAALPELRVAGVSRRFVELAAAAPKPPRPLGLLALAGGSPAPDADLARAERTLAAWGVEVLEAGLSEPWDRAVLFVRAPDLAPAARALHAAFRLAGDPVGDASAG